MDSNKKYKILKEMNAVDKIKTASNKKRTRIAAQKIFKKYKNMKRPKRTFVVDEDDIETIDYNEPLQEDVFAEKSILNAANRVLDFEHFKKEQEKRLQEYNNQLLEDAETINYVDDVSLNNVRENKNLKMTAKMVNDKYRKIRQKRKAATSTPNLHKISKTFVPDKKKYKASR